MTKTMADIITAHLYLTGDEYDLRYIPAIRLLANDVERELSAAGFGLVADAGAEALEDAADEFESNVGGGIDSGECEDWSAWLRARAAAVRGEG